MGHFSTSKKCKKSYSMETFTNSLALSRYTHIPAGRKRGFQLLKIMRFDGPVLFHLLLQTQVTPILSGNIVLLLSTTSNLQCVAQPTNQPKREGGGGRNGVPLTSPAQASILNAKRDLRLQAVPRPGVCHLTRSDPSPLSLQFMRNLGSHSHVVPSEVQRLLS